MSGSVNTKKKKKLETQGWRLGGDERPTFRRLGGGRRESGGRGGGRGGGYTVTKKENTRREEAVHEAGVPRSAGGQAGDGV